jgi:hypothetical protein
MRGYVYAIRSLSDPTLVYYGSTKETLARRMAGHRVHYRAFLAEKRDFVTSFRVLEAGDAYIELVEIVEYEEKAQLHAAEGKCIRENLCVNKAVAGRTRKQHQVDNSVRLNAKAAAYYAVHAEHINAKQTCACGGQFTHKHEARHLRSLKHCVWVEKTA